MQKKIVTIAVAVISIVAHVASISAQTVQSQNASQSNSVTDRDIEMLRADLRSQRKQIMAQNMNLTPEEATKFWPIFDQYRKEAIQPNDERWAVMKEYAANYGKLSDIQAREYMKRAAAVDEQLLALRMKYVPIFEKFLSPQKTALWYQIDRRIDIMYDLQLAALIPLSDNTTK